MSFFKKLFSGGAATPALYLAAFGKHPGWNDHIDDIGFDTDALVTAKRLLYTQGISQNIDSGAWENIEAENKLNAFQHDFLWHMPPGSGGAGTALAGRLWASTDGKKRDKYPMGLCAQTTGVPDAFGGEVVLPKLAKAAERCKGVKTAGEVVKIVDETRQELRTLVVSPNAHSASVLTAKQLLAVANHPQMLDGRVGFHRIVYQMSKGLSAYRSGAGKGSRRPEQLRLPAAGMGTRESLLFYLRMLLGFIDASSPILLIAPDQGEAAAWVDVVVGEPAPANLFCFKAGLKSVPLTSDIPYTLDGAFTGFTDRFLEACAGAPENAALPPWPAL